MKGNDRRTYPMMDKDKCNEYVSIIKGGVKYTKMIYKCQDWLISTMYNLEANDSTSKNHTMNTRYI